MSQPQTLQHHRIPGIVADAQALGVHRTTLWKMLHGYPGFVNLKTLRRRYDELQASKATFLTKS